jgi:hypothetical protein
MLMRLRGKTAPAEHAPASGGVFERLGLFCPLLAKSAGARYAASHRRKKRKFKKTVDNPAGDVIS